jgi:hypothetical protein
LCLDPALNEATTLEVGWWLLSSPGKEGLQEIRQPPGRVQDCRTVEGRLRCGDYELLQQPKTFRDGAGKAKTVTTWTWRLKTQRYREWEALLVERARQRDQAQLERLFECLVAMPMFAGVRAQVIRLAAETNKVLAKVRGCPVTLPPLPAMRMLKLWHEDDAW